jgi:hypothetical protein
VYVPACVLLALVIAGFCNVEENDEGPFHIYDAPDTVFAVRLSVCPVHTGVFADAAGALGVAFTVAVVFVVRLQPFSVTTAVYVPVATAETPVIEGDCKVDAKPLGPVHDHVVLLLLVLPFRVNVPPEQTGPLLVAPRFAGNGFIVTFSVSVFLHPLMVDVTVTT